MPHEDDADRLILLTVGIAPAAKRSALTGAATSEEGAMNAQRRRKTGPATTTAEPSVSEEASEAIEPEEATAAAEQDRAIDLGTIERGILWGRLALTQTQLAELTGLSQRQISRWVAHGLLVPSPHHPERFNGDAIEQAILMQRAIALGNRPRRASRLASLALAQQTERDPNFPVPAAPDAREKLLAARTAITAALDILFPGSPSRDYPLVGLSDVSDVSNVSDGATQSDDGSDGDEPAGDGPDPHTA
jgi:hypothetical protein